HSKTRLFCFPDTAGITSYVPKITQNVTFGNLSYSSFLLDQPLCIFNENINDDIWLVVATGSAKPTLTTAELSEPVDQSLRKSYYHTLRATGRDYPCQISSSAVAILAVGSQNCSGISYCNAKLKSNESYWVKFVVLGEYVAETQWSNQIITKEYKNFTPNSVPPNTDGMIALTIILGVLLAILLICLIIALLIGSKDICWHRTFDSRNLISWDMGRGSLQAIHNSKDHIYM
uniref:Uroplakin 3B n=1 Tax=Leptobrachium leishanense TaxID=445787 RepID=A0A8C5QF45_9ANUR